MIRKGDVVAVVVTASEDISRAELPRRRWVSRAPDSRRGLRLFEEWINVKMIEKRNVSNALLCFYSRQKGQARLYSIGEGRYINLTRRSGFAWSIEVTRSHSHRCWLLRLAQPRCIPLMLLEACCRAMKRVESSNCKRCRDGLPHDGYIIVQSSRTFIKPSCFVRVVKEID